MNYTITETITTNDISNNISNNISNDLSNDNKILILRLRGRKYVKFTEDTIDNEGLGRKSSKRCCIFHKRKAFGESSSESSNESSSDSDNDMEKNDLYKNTNDNLIPGNFTKICNNCKKTHTKIKPGQTYHA